MDATEALASSTRQPVRPTAGPPTDVTSPGLGVSVLDLSESQAGVNTFKFIYQHITFLNPQCTDLKMP